MSSLGIQIQLTLLNFVFCTCLDEYPFNVVQSLLLDLQGQFDTQRSNRHTRCLLNLQLF